ncbi:glycosyltransferase [Leuconostoc citreum]|uniref:glycosyltransferase n=1 Tax=Leuconostoc citreum TaxID=33964 RepID=UPI000EE69D30|nr:glycosyltransferase [Leuconostoc citreum]MCJ2166618.1 glycosyltransferase [Leuconostoc citreum]MCT3071892.1 glycosyltransferase [Leuconostoc citreum]MDY5161984.1 glycosyltransferase [Leuconostoc citreum]MDY5165538.1 glycosyltransferase [Leuconostoc citreum]QEA36649.1 glycosyltransferase [Leuconostoc citreum]
MNNYSNSKYPLFSVLMSIYYKEKADFFRVALESICQQSVKPNDVVVVVDGPIPEDLEFIISQFEQKLPINVVRLPVNKGLGYALSKGLLYTKYDIVARADSDDINDENRFEIQLNKLLKNPQLSIIGGQVAEFNTNPTIIESQRIVPITEREIYKFAKRRSPFNHPTVLFRKSAILQAGGYIDFPPFEDYHLWVRLLITGHLSANVPEVLVKMRLGNKLYQRRGGVKYLLKYIELRSYFYRSHFISVIEYIRSVLLMTINIMLPVKLRKVAYSVFLRRQK